MSIIAAALIIVSAFFHASWNFVSKRRNPSLAFFFISAVSAAVIMSPVLVVQRHTLPHIPSAIWMLVLATGIAQAVYFFGLAGAYRRGDMSLAYPLARALPVLLVAAISLALGRGADIGFLGLAGMVLIAAGCIMLPHPNFREIRLREYADIVFLMAIIAAIGTTGYTLIDDQALRQLRAMPGSRLSNIEVTLLFISLQTISTALMLGIAALLFRPERRQLPVVLRDRSIVVPGLVTGVVIMATYGLVLTSMAYVTNVSYVAAFRQLSIPIGVMLGITLQHEPRHLPKLIGTAIVSAGLVMVTVG
ncbi:MAG: EamA family transporter [Candidatus Promineifilaceae bacterium]|jgi:drug/metabolite transporter (DMT)-like permease